MLREVGAGMWATCWPAKSGPNLLLARRRPLAPIEVGRVQKAPLIVPPPSGAYSNEAGPFLCSHSQEPPTTSGRECTFWRVRRSGRGCGRAEPFDSPARSPARPPARSLARSALGGDTQARPLNHRAWAAEQKQRSNKSSCCSIVGALFLRRAIFASARLVSLVLSLPCSQLPPAGTQKLCWANLRASLDANLGTFSKAATTTTTTTAAAAAAAATTERARVMISRRRRRRRAADKESCKHSDGARHWPIVWPARGR